MSWNPEPFPGSQGVGGQAGSGSLGGSGSGASQWPGTGTSPWDPGGPGGGGAPVWPSPDEAPVEGSAWGNEGGATDLWGGGFDGGSPGPVAALPPGRPPVPWIAGAAASAGLALIGGLLAAFVLNGSLPLALVSWLLAGPVAIALLGQFVKGDERQRARAFYDGSWARPATVGVGILAILGVTASAYVIANWVATR